MKKILIVEDQLDIRKLIRMTLELDEFQIAEAASGAQGLQMASESRPDLMLLDVMMPGELDGLQVCQRIKRDPELKRIKVVMLSARAQRGDVQAGRSAGADAYLVKPFSPLELSEVVAKQLR